MFRKIPLAWLQLSHEKTRLVVAVAGVTFAIVLMLMQFAFQDALYESTSIIQSSLRGELFLISTKTRTISAMRSFPRNRLYQTLGDKKVVSVTPIYVGYANWKNPQDGTSHLILALGVDPNDPGLSVPGIEEGRRFLTQEDTVLFDRLSRDEYGAIALAVDQKDPIFVEINNRRTEVAGLVDVGASFAANGNFITSDSGFLRLFPARSPGVVDLGIIRLRPGADLSASKQTLQALFPDGLRVLTGDEFIGLEQEYWAEETAIGFIFGQGVVLGFIVGFVIVCQILFADVSRHLPEYATLKAIGYTDRALIGVILRESLILSALGYPPGVALAAMIGRLTAQITFLPLYIHTGRAALVLVLTAAMCSLSGLVAMRKLRSADPAEVF
jgi:putative ABC transport system permease protein